MLTYILVGAIVGGLIGIVVPPGYLLWFLIGAVSGYLAQRYLVSR